MLRFLGRVPYVARVLIPPAAQAQELAAPLAENFAGGGVGGHRFATDGSPESRFVPAERVRVLQREACATLAGLPLHLKLSERSLQSDDSLAPSPTERVGVGVILP